MATNKEHRRRPNIVLVLIDTLRADRLSCYRNGARTSPCIDRIAERGVLYENAISPAAWTVPAHASLFTGTYPSRHGVDLSRLVLAPELAPLPEILRRHGYRTFGVSSNYWLSRETLFDRGFDEFVHSWQLVQTAGTNQPLKRQQRKMPVGLQSHNGSGTRHPLRRDIGNALNWLHEEAVKRLRQSFHAYDSGAWRVNRQVRRWVRRWAHMQEPFFAFVHYMEPHIRYAAPGRYRTLHVPPGIPSARIDKVNQDPWRFLAGHAPMTAEDFAILRGLYDGEVSYVDFRVGQLYDSLQREGLLRNTILIITSDHGENLGDHGLMSHAYCLYDTLVRVPLIVSYPGVFPAGERVWAPVQTLDLFPTLLTLAEVRDSGPWSQVQGESLTSVPRSDRLMFSEYPEPEPSVSVITARYPEFDGSPYDRSLRAVRTATHKYIQGSDGRDELYDLTSDAGEEHDLRQSHPQIAADLRGALARWVGSFEHAPAARETIELDGEMRRRLEDLGYLA
jgi:arylsulfatase A-like enzyme